MMVRTLSACLLLSCSLAVSAKADGNCSAIEDTAQRIFESLSPIEEDISGDLCEAELEEARTLMSEGRDQAQACGCDLMVDGFDMMIENSHSSDYECWNKRQGIRSTVMSSVGDTVSFCPGG